MEKKKIIHVLVNYAVVRNDAELHTSSWTYIHDVLPEKRRLQNSIHILILF